jgi:bidirectional [NiFe] hydrogenase diaphorase subunit
MVHLTIDGKNIEVEEGTTILQAAAKAGCKIPSLCFHPILEPYAACRVCVVEALSRGKSDIITSCNAKAEDGMDIQTSSERALRARRLNVELLLARAPAAEPVRRLAADLGITSPRFPAKDPDETCILCGLCVRACEQIVGAGRTPRLHPLRRRVGGLHRLHGLRLCLPDGIHLGRGYARTPRPP